MLNILPNEIIEKILCYLSLHDVINITLAFENVNDMISSDTEGFMRHWLKKHENFIRIDSFPLMRHTIIQTLIQNFNIETLDLIEREYSRWKNSIGSNTRCKYIYKRGTKKGQYCPKFTYAGDLFCSSCSRVRKLDNRPELDMTLYINVFYSKDFPKKGDREPSKADFLLMESITRLDEYYYEKNLRGVFGI